MGFGLIHTYEEWMGMSSIYHEHGFNSRKEYLQDLASEYGIPEETVFSLADILTESEDFEGLVSMCQEAEGRFITTEWR